jgi:hypothetical protein
MLACIDGNYDGKSYLEVCGGPQILYKVRRQSSFMTVGLVVEVDNMGLREFILRILDKVVNGGDVGECLHSKLAVEPTAESIEDLVLLLGSMPNYSGD